MRRESDIGNRSSHVFMVSTLCACQTLLIVGKLVMGIPWPWFPDSLITYLSLLRGILLGVHFLNINQLIQSPPLPHWGHSPCPLLQK